MALSTYIVSLINNTHAPVPVAAWSNVLVCGRSLPGITGSNPTGVMDFCLLWVLCVVRKWSVRRADHSSRGVLPSVVSVTECDREFSTVRRPWPTRGCRAMANKNTTHAPIPVAARSARCLRPLACWNCGFESRVWGRMSVCCDCCVLCRYRFLSQFLLV